MCNIVCEPDLKQKPAYGRNLKEPGSWVNKMFFFKLSNLVPKLVPPRPHFSSFKNVGTASTTKKEEAQKRREIFNKTHCLQIVKKFDYENFLATLYIANGDLRRTAFALRAFNVELSQVRDLTKSDQLAKIRFQFWLDIIDDIYNNESKNDGVSEYLNFPVANELKEVLSTGSLSKHWLRKLVTIRSKSKYLSDFPFQTLEEVETYCDSSVTSLYYLLNEKIIQLSGSTSAGYRIELDHIASHLGKAQGLTNLLRGIRHNANYRRCYIPNEIIARYKCTHEDFLRAVNKNTVSDAIFEIASHANSHLEHCLELIGNTKKDKQYNQTFLPVFTVKIYLEQLERCNFNIFDSKLYNRNGLLPLKLWWKSKISYT